MIGTILSAGINLMASHRATKAQKSQARRMRQAYDKAYAMAKELTPEEQKYINRMEERASSGDPNAGAMRNLVMSNIAQQRQRGQQGAQSIAIRSGLENSIVADELRRRVDRETLQQIGQESQKLAMANRQYREQAQGQLDQYQLQRSQMLKQMGIETVMGKAGIASDSEIGNVAYGQWLGQSASALAGSIGSGIDNMISEGKYDIPTFFSGSGAYGQSGSGGTYKYVNGVLTKVN